MVFEFLVIRKDCDISIILFFSEHDVGFWVVFIVLFYRFKHSGLMMWGYWFEVSGFSNNTRLQSFKIVCRYYF